MQSRAMIALASLGVLVVAFVAYQWLQSEPHAPADAPREAVQPLPPTPAPGADLREVERVAPEITGAEAPEPRPLLRGDDLERALPELVELARAGDVAAFDQIMAGLEDSGNQARERSVLAVGNVGDASIVGELEPLLRDPDPDVREALVKTLVKLGGDEAKPLLMGLAMDDDPDVVEDAMQALVSADYSPAIPVIRDVLDHGHPENTVKAAKFLREFGDHASANAALARVAKGLDSPSAIERRDTVADIRTIGGEGALAYLEAAMEDPDPAIRREVADAMLAITESLQE